MAEQFGKRIEGESLRIERVCGDRRRFMPLLLIGDESEEMIGRYFGSGELYVGYLGGEAVAVCQTVEVSETVTEVKNLAVRPEWQRHGFGRKMLAFAEGVNRGRRMILGTGETPSTLRFYHSCGYSYSHRIPRFFTDNYPSPIIEEGVMLTDMIYLTKQL